MNSVASNEHLGVLKCMSYYGNIFVLLESIGMALRSVMGRCFVLFVLLLLCSMYACETTFSLQEALVMCRLSLFTIHTVCNLFNYKCMHVCVYVCACVHVCMHVCVCVCVCDQDESHYIKGLKTKRYSVMKKVTKVNDLCT